MEDANDEMVKWTNGKKAQESWQNIPFLFASSPFPDCPFIDSLFTFLLFSLFNQGFRISQIRRIKAFGEPVVDVR